MHFSLKGTVITLIVGLLTVPTIVSPWLQNAALRHSTVILDLVRNNFVDTGAEDACGQELTWVLVIYFVFVAVLATVFSYYRNKRSLKIPWLMGHIMVQFYLLQTPFFIFIAGEDFNCVANPNAMDAVYISSTMVSGVLILFGALYDFTAPTLKEQATNGEERDLKDSGRKFSDN